MKNKKTLMFVAVALITVLAADAQQLPDMHDPVAIKEGDTWYVLSTGRGIGVLASTDLVKWSQSRPVLDPIPQWALDAVPGYRGHTWAPDIIRRGDTYYVYYSVSAFGKNTSAIGVATSKALDPASPDYGWTDHGKVIRSVPNRDMWNAIDPNIVIDDNGTAWMSFGSFWDGIKMVRLSADMLSVAQPEEWHSLSRRPRDFDLGAPDPGNGAVEAPFIFRKGDYYYLFVSFDYCCRGERSDYKVVVGRSRDVYGPYLDRDGVDMYRGGATLVIAGNERFPGVGHCSVYNFDGRDLMFFHGYDMTDRGLSKLLIRELFWDADGWPTARL